MSLVLGVTGGIGSGKSTFTEKLLKGYSSKAFNADLAARDLLENDQEIQVAIGKAFPGTVIAGEVNREALRELVFSDKSKRQQLEGFLHPRIRKQWMTLAEETRSHNGRLIIDIPLLFETGAEKYFDAIVVVGCSQSIQIQRLKNHRQIPEAMAQSIIAAQNELPRKISSADFVIWNESTLDHLEMQAKLLAGYLKQRYG